MSCAAPAFRSWSQKAHRRQVLTGEGGIPGMPDDKTPAPNSGLFPPKARDRPANPPVLTAFLEETAQLFLCWPRGEISVVYLDADGFNPDQWRDIADRCHDRGENSAGWPFRRYSVPMPRGIWGEPPPAVPGRL